MALGTGPSVVVVAGCLARPTLPPESFLQRVQFHGSSFALATPPPGAMLMDAAIRDAKMGMEHDPAPVQAIYGTVTCPDAPTCSQAFDTNSNPRIDRSKVSAFPVGVVWSLATTGPDVGVWFAWNADTRRIAFCNTRIRDRRRPSKPPGRGRRSTTPRRPSVKRSG